MFVCTWRNAFALRASSLSLSLSLSLTSTLQLSGRERRELPGVSDRHTSRGGGVDSARATGGHWNRESGSKGYLDTGFTRVFPCLPFSSVLRGIPWPRATECENPLEGSTDVVCSAKNISRHPFFLSPPQKK